MSESCLQWGFSPTLAGDAGGRRCQKASCFVPTVETTGSHRRSLAATTVASNKWAPWRLWESTWMISGMKSLNISRCTIGFRHHLRHLPVHFVIAPLVLTPLAINLVYQFVWWAAHFFQVPWEISQVAVMIIFVWRQIHSWGQIHNKLTGCKGREAPWIMWSWRFATGVGRDGEVWGHFAGSTTTHVRDLKFQRWKWSRILWAKALQSEKPPCSVAKDTCRMLQKLINDNCIQLPCVTGASSLTWSLKIRIIGKWYLIRFAPGILVLNPFHVVALTTVLLFWFVFFHACPWTQRLNGNLRLIFPSLNKATSLFTCHVESSWRSQATAPKRNRSWMFGIYSVHLMTEVFITLQTTQNIWKVQKHGTQKWWFPKGISTSICPFSGSIFVLGVSILQRGQLKISGAARSQQKSRRVPSSVPIWRARIAISEDASWFLDEYGPGTPGDFRTPLEIGLPVELFPEDFPKVMCLEGCNILKSHLVSPGN